MKFKNIFLSTLLAMGCVAASAEEAKTENVFKPHWYLQIQGGAQYTLGELPFNYLISPNVQVGVGYNFNKVVGARFSVNAWQSKAGLNTWESIANNNGTWVEGPTKNWKWNYVAPMVDVTANLTNLFCSTYNPKRLINVGVFAGIGANVAWGNDDIKGIENYLGYPWDGTAVRLTGRAGANVDFRISDAVSLGIELNANMLNDKYNSKKAGNADWYFNGLVGAKINLGKTYTTRKVEPVAPVERVIERVVEKQVPVEKVVEKPCCEKKAETLRRDIFFTIASNKITSSEEKKVNEVVDFLKANPKAKVTVTGYADKGTGNNDINDRIAAKRAQIVYDALVKKGVSSSRIVKDSKGSRVQPFNVNEENRVTICIAE